MNGIDQQFAELRKSQGKAFIPFVTAGDPDLDFTLDALRTLADSGATVCEVGIPYSDPIADGPVIQASYTRALASGIQVSPVLQGLAQVSPHLSTPLVTMVSYAIVYRMGLEKYVQAAKQAGVEGLIVPDLLVEESDELAALCRKEQMSLIQLVTPTTSKERAIRIAEASSGFLYYVSVAGITGERRQLPPELVERVDWLRQRTPIPVCIGFGISQPDQARQLAEVADGIIVGSAFVRRIAQANQQNRSQVLSELGEFTRQMVQALRPSETAR